MAIVDIAETQARDAVIEMIDGCRENYSPRFRDWLLTNWSMWREFRLAADKVRDRGIKGYSAYVIVNVLRWQADIRGIRFSMTNTFIPDLARLYNALYGPLFTTSSRFGKETAQCSSAT